MFTLCLLCIVNIPELNHKLRSWKKPAEHSSEITFLTQSSRNLLRVFLLIMSLVNLKLGPGLKAKWKTWPLWPIFTSLVRKFLLGDFLKEIENWIRNWVTSSTKSLKMFRLIVLMISVWKLICMESKLVGITVKPYLRQIVCLTFF